MSSWTSSDLSVPQAGEIRQQGMSNTNSFEL